MTDAFCIKCMKEEFGFKSVDARELGLNSAVM